jgi:CDP-diacylglycerol pyrophosphatase
VTRGMKTMWILSSVAGLTVSTSFATFAIGLDRMALWQVVRACVADFKLTGTPFPCLEVDLSGGEERGNVVLLTTRSAELSLEPILP